MHRQSALTLIELLVVVTIIGIISLPLYVSYTRNQSNQGLRASAEMLADTLRSAHIFAREARDLRAWGVKSSGSNKFVLVKGTTQTPKVEKTVTLEPFVLFPQPFEIWFVIGTGDTPTNETIEIENKHGRKYKIEVSTTGVVEVVSQ
jgi:prepilin-type N-terminal cleavage/methylation domain-containing protein